MFGIVHTYLKTFKNFSFISVITLGANFQTDVYSYACTTENHPTLTFPFSWYCDLLGSMKGKIKSASYSNYRCNDISCSQNVKCSFVWLSVT